jgi:hypothetical protein
MENQIDQTKFLIQRYDNYISGANTKGNFLLAFITFLTGSIVTNYCKLTELIKTELGLLLFNISLASIIIINLIILGLVIKAVYPFLKSGNSSKEKYHSHVYFNSVAEFEDGKSFYESFSKQSDNDIMIDLANQAFQLANGLEKKYYFLRLSMKAVFIEIFFIAFLVFVTLFL